MRAWTAPWPDGRCLRAHAMPGREQHNRYHTSTWLPRRLARQTTLCLLAVFPMAAGQFLGFCEPTSDGGDCTQDRKGSRKMVSLINCISFCRTCDNCVYISHSEANVDCSWYSQCNLQRLNIGEPGTTYTTLRVMKIPTSASVALSSPQLAQISPTTGLQSHLQEQVDVSILFQFWGGSGRDAYFAEGFADFVIDVSQCLSRLRLRYEILINLDSRHLRHGDAKWIATRTLTAGGPVYILLSPNLGETRAYNKLAAMARGSTLLLMQDDWRLLAPGRCPSILGAALRLISQSSPRGAVVGMDTVESQSTP
mmetsp:Transcript_34112/g.74887  ORF Transcript_34112/g.74887 Transcript_34112/m.74887 type:complete len:310 (-) Transcript_34112:2350-3279(-)|eukprot:6212499-Pleurochrysis_carterae.AAC.4